MWSTALSAAVPEGPRALLLAQLALWAQLVLGASCAAWGCCFGKGRKKKSKELKAAGNNNNNPPATAPAPNAANNNNILDPKPGADNTNGEGAAAAGNNAVSAAKTLKKSISMSWAG